MKKYKLFMLLIFVSLLTFSVKPAAVNAEDAQLNLPVTQFSLDKNIQSQLQHDFTNDSGMMIPAPPEVDHGFYVTVPVTH